MFRLGAPLLALGAVAAPLGAHAGGWAPTATQAMPVSNIAGQVPLAATTPMRIAVGLNVRNKPQLDALVADVNNPRSVNFGRTITPAQFLQTYAPTADQAKAVAGYLASQGFSSVTVSDNRLLVTAQGSAAAVERAFNTQLVQFAQNGKLVFANTQPAQVPASLGGTVAAVVGLQNMGTMHTQIEYRGAQAVKVPATPKLPNIGPPADPLTTAPFSGPQYQLAYDAGNTPTGYGTTIGIVTEGDLTQVPKDLRQYEKEFHLPQVPYEIVPTGVQTSDTAGLDEWDLDSQSSSGIAGNLRKIIFYNAGSLADADLIPAYEKIVSENRVKAVNMSFGGCETLEYLSGGMLIADLAYEQGSAEGISFFASSGDGGASCQLVANAGQPMVLGAVEYPASSEYAVAVGGTSLFINTDGTYDFETSWVSGGGGTSLWEVPGPWTSGKVPPVNSTAGQRPVPDIAMVGDPNIGGADVVVNGSDVGVGGTSLSSPLSVGTWARLQSAHGNCYGFAAPILYDTLGQSFPTAALQLHDIVAGDNFLYPATPGWDYTTGMGSFDIAAVNAALPPITCLPEAPVSLTAAPVSGQILLNWAGSPGATSYNVYEGTAAGAEGAKPIAGSANTSTVISGLATGKTYYFTVKAVNSVGASAASNEASAVLPLVPKAPTGLAGTPGNTTATLKWTAVAGATSYDVYQGTAAGGEKAVPVATGVTGTTATVSGLANGSTYYFVVTGLNDGGQGPKSNEAKVALPATPRAPSTVDAVTGSAAGTVTVSWTAASGAASYNVYEGTASDGEAAAPVQTGVKGTSVTIGHLTSGQQYFFQVTSVGVYGAMSGKSQEAAATAK